MELNFCNVIEILSVFFSSNVEAKILRPNLAKKDYYCYYYCFFIAIFVVAFVVSL